jgi:hypothetical protein
MNLFPTSYSVFPILTPEIRILMGSTAVGLRPASQGAFFAQL